MSRLDDAHDRDCPVACGADPDLCRCDTVEPTPRPVTRTDHKRMHLLWRKAGVTDRARRLELTSELVGWPLSSSKQLRDIDVRLVLGRLTYMDEAGELRSWAALAGRDGQP